MILVAGECGRAAAAITGGYATQGVTVFVLAITRRRPSV